MNYNERMLRAIRFANERRAQRTAGRIATRQLIREDELDAAELQDLIALYPDWVVGKAYVVGDLVVYQAKLYEVIQAHTSQDDWRPDAVPAMYVEKTAPGVIPNWSQPLGAHDAYNIGDKVTHDGQVWVSTIDANTWAPGVHGWEVM